jgi:hypothetical protein
MSHATRPLSSSTFVLSTQFSMSQESPKATNTKTHWDISQSDTTEWTMMANIQPMMIAPNVTQILEKSTVVEMHLSVPLDELAKNYSKVHHYSNGP